jgi:nucleotide-binding universal stress UspA family protein
VLGSVARALVHQSPIPTLVLRQNEATALLSQANPASPLRTLVPLDGSPEAEAALGQAASLTSALATPGRGALHLSQVVKIFPTTAAEGFVSELNEEALQRASVYLSRVEERLHSEARDLRLSLTHSVELDSDVASALVDLAEHEKGEEIGVCHLIAISTHGRGDLERWVMGSITERLLTATKLPLLLRGFSAPGLAAGARWFSPSPVRFSGRSPGFFQWDRVSGHACQPVASRFPGQDHPTH